MNENIKHKSASLPDLMHAVREGNQDAFSELVAKYRPLIDHAVKRFADQLPGEESREDMRQEAMVAFFDAIRSYHMNQEKVEFGLYAKVCITNRLISHLRREQKQVGLISWEEISAEQIFSGQADDLLSVIIAEEDTQALSRLIQENLSPYEYDVFLFYMKGRTSSEIARFLQKSVKSIDNAIARIRKKLKNLLQDRL